MGYYVSLTDTNANIPADKLDEAYKLLCDLNQRNDLKTGGVSGWTHGRTPEGETPIDGPHDKIWFSWMDWNYPETCKDAAAVLEKVGYEIYFTDDGTLVFGGYDNKTGCEDEFIKALAPVLVSADDQPVQFVWRGEDGSLWRHLFTDEGVKEQEGVITFQD